MVASRERLNNGAGGAGKRKRNRRHTKGGGRETGEGQVEKVNYQNDDMVE